MRQPQGPASGRWPRFRPLLSWWFGLVQFGGGFLLFSLLTLNLAGIEYLALKFIAPAGDQVFSYFGVPDWTLDTALSIVVAVVFTLLFSALYAVLIGVSVSATRQRWGGGRVSAGRALLEGISTAPRAFPATALIHLALLLLAIITGSPHSYFQPAGLLVDLSPSIQLAATMIFYMVFTVILAVSGFAAIDSIVRKAGLRAALRRSLALLLSALGRVSGFWGGAVLWSVVYGLVLWILLVHWLAESVDILFIQALVSWWIAPPIELAAAHAYLKLSEEVDYTPPRMRPRSEPSATPSS